MAYINGKKVLQVVRTEVIGEKKVSFDFDLPPYHNEDDSVWTRIEFAQANIGSYSVTNNGYHTEVDDTPPYPVFNDNNFGLFGRFSFGSFTDNNNEQKYGLRGLDSVGTSYYGIELSIFVILKEKRALSTSNYIIGTTKMKVLLWNTTANEYQEKVVNYTANQQVTWGSSAIHGGYGLKINIPNDCILLNIYDVEITGAVA